LGFLTKAIIQTAVMLEIIAAGGFCPWLEFEQNDSSEKDAADVPLEDSQCRVRRRARQSQAKPRKRQFDERGATVQDDTNNTV
jgi:hypothetical protein